jgi:hypothetical protein
LDCKPAFRGASGDFKQALPLLPVQEGMHRTGDKGQHFDPSGPNDTATDKEVQQKRDFYCPATVVFVPATKTPEKAP